MKVGTGKFRTDRHHIPCIPIEYQIYKKIRNQKEIQENLVISKTESVGQFSQPNPRILSGIFRFLPEFIPEISVVFFPSLFPKLVLHRIRMRMKHAILSAAAWAPRSSI